MQVKDGLKEGRFVGRNDGLLEGCEEILGRKDGEIDGFKLIVGDTEGDGVIVGLEDTEGESVKRGGQKPHDRGQASPTSV